MEAKKKAEELVAIFGKELAVKCVDEILNINKEIWDNLADSYFKYWLEVKQEILNL